MRVRSKRRLDENIVWLLRKHARPGDHKPAVEGFGDPDLCLHTAFIHKTKAEIVEIGTSLDVAYEDTWSCYEGSELHCGLCGTCNERKEAFQLANVPNPTKYRE